jgi:2-polyprenyl-3-methyl-5-hydroxy-6-metoxy-1,4-benzoquinol methylase
MTGGYDPSHFASLVAVEDRHFWFRARNRVISRVAAQSAAAFSPGYRVLEVGCGDGNVLRFLEGACPDGTVVGMDYFAEGLQYARQRCSCALVQADLVRPPFSKAFHLIGMFDVLEHMSDDRAVLRDLRSMLDARGKLLLTVPAQPKLWSSFDEESGHCRRYEKEELERKLKECGYKIEYLTAYMAGIYPLMWLSRRLSRTSAPNGGRGAAVRRELRVVPVLNEMLALALSAEAWWIGHGRRLPLGTALLAVAERD